VLCVVHLCAFSTGWCLTCSFFLSSCRSRATIFFNWGYWERVYHRDVVVPRDGPPCGLLRPLSAPRSAGLPGPDRPAEAAPAPAPIVSGGRAGGDGRARPGGGTLGVAAGGPAVADGPKKADDAGDVNEPSPGTAGAVPKGATGDANALPTEERRPGAPNNEVGEGGLLLLLPLLLVPVPPPPTPTPPPGKLPASARTVCCGGVGGDDFFALASSSACRGASADTRSPKSASGVDGVEVGSRNGRWAAAAIVSLALELSGARTPCSPLVPLRLPSPAGLAVPRRFILCGAAPPAGTRGVRAGTLGGLLRSVKAPEPGTGGGTLARSPVSARADGCAGGAREI